MNKLRNTVTLTTAAMLLALAAILGMLKIPVNQFIEIRFGSLPISVAGNLFGPIVAALIGGLADIVQFIVRPTGPYFPGFTISGAVSGVIFGIFFFKKNLTWLRILVAETVHTVVVGIFLNTYWLMLLYGNKTYMAILIGRLPKEIVMIPILTVLMYGIAKAVEKVRGRIQAPKEA
jgi:ECF transporter S component (folate family)